MTRAAMTEAYQDTKGIVYKSAYTFARRYGGDVQELISEAHEHFTTAFFTADHRSEFTAWVGYRVGKGLLETRRKEVYRSNRLKRIAKRLDFIPGPTAHGLRSILFQVGDDAKTVIELLVESPKSLTNLIRQFGKTPKGYRSALTMILSGRGWSADQIVNAFRQISEAL